MENLFHEEEENIHYEVISKYLATHSNYYDTSSKLSILGNITRVETLTPNFNRHVETLNKNGLVFFHFD